MGSLLSVIFLKEIFLRGLHCYKNACCRRVVTSVSWLASEEGEGQLYAGTNMSIAPLDAWVAKMKSNFMNRKKRGVHG